MSLLVVAVCLFTFKLSMVRSAPSTFVFPEEENNNTPLNINDKLKECLADDFKIEFKGECRALLKPDSNVCPKDHWIVLDLSAASLPSPLIRGKCALQRCSSDQHFWLDQKRCVDDNESLSLCPVGSIVDTDFFGDGFCNCIKNPVHIKDEKSGACYAAFTKGPCSMDRVWSVEGCRLDNCKVTRARFPNKTIVPWSDGKCYAVNEQGPCKQGNDVSINLRTQTPECVDRLTSLHLVDAPCTGSDHSGKCTQPVQPPHTTFYSQVAAQAHKKRN